MEKNAERTRLRRFSRWYDDVLGGLFPRFALVPIAACYLFNCLVYFGTQQLMSGAVHRCMETPLDRLIPFQPGWVWAYAAFFPFWLYGYFRTARLGREDFERLAAAHMLAELGCCLLFVLLPTTNVRPALPSGLSSAVLGLVYRLDPPTDLFPSIHCMVSWMCWLGVRGDPRVSRTERLVFCLVAVAICASTLFVRQHVLADVLAGTALAAGSLHLMRRTGAHRPFTRLFRRLNRLVFGESLL